MFSVFGAIITSAFSYEDSYSKPGPDLSFPLANLDGGGGGGGYPPSTNDAPYPPSSSDAGYPPSTGGGYPPSSGAGGGYDYTPHQTFDHHDHHDHHEHHPEPPKGHWEKKLKWKEDWVYIYQIIESECFLSFILFIFLFLLLIVKKVKEWKTIKKQAWETKWKAVSVPVWKDIESMF